MKRNRHSRMKNISWYTVFIAGMLIITAITIFAVTSETGKENSESEQRSETVMQSGAPEMPVTLGENGAKKAEQTELQEKSKAEQIAESIEKTAVGEIWEGKDIDIKSIAAATAETFVEYDIAEYGRYGGAFPLCIQAYTKYVCDTYGVDYALILAMIETESGYRYNAVSCAGCMGFMQISERWHKDRMSKCGVDDLFDPYGNIHVGVDFMAELLRRYDGNELKALAAYNMGATGAYKNLWQYGKLEYSYTDKVLSKKDRIGGILNDTGH